LKFIFDNNISSRLVSFLKDITSGDFPADHCEHLCDRFSRDIKDDAFLKAVISEKDWILVTCDNDFRYKTLRTIWKGNAICIIAFYGDYQGLRGLEKSWKLLKCWPDIRRAISEHKDTQFFLVDKNLSVNPKQ